MSISPRSCRGVCIKRLFNEFGAWHKRRYTGFTILELLTVIAIIIVLAGLILGTAGYVQKKGARSRAETEIAAMSAALENYKADNGVYPTNSATSALDPVNDTNAATTAATKYAAASLYLYKELSGDHDANRVVNPSDDLSGAGVTPKTYFTFRPNMLIPPPPSTANVTGIRDPFGNSYGYSTMKASGGSNGFNPTFDLWSTAGSTDPNQWLKNW
jgi:type II secretory pathway pseudopilin PulG